MKSLCIIIFISFLFGTNSLFVNAHGGGVSHEETKDGYFIDIGYQILPIAFEQIRFDFNTYIQENPEIEDIYTDVWVRISRDRELFFSGGIGKSFFGATGFTYAFPEEGTYEILARFQKDADVVVESSFTMEVLPEPNQNAHVNPYAAASVAFVLGSVVTFLLGRRKKQRSL